MALEFKNLSISDFNICAILSAKVISYFLASPSDLFNSFNILLIVTCPTLSESIQLSIVSLLFL